MDPVSLVVAAVVAGASVGLGETATTAVRDSYQALKILLRDAFHGSPGETVVKAELDSTKPDADALKHELEAGDVARRQDIVESARALLSQVDPEGIQSGKYNVSVSGSGVVGNIGDGNTSTINLGRQ